MLSYISKKICNHKASYLPDLIATFAQSPKNKKAFTLVELSIVIVIIGLIIGGVTAGVSLIKQAQLRSVVTESREYQTAVTSFYLQYNALPGDINNAYSYWGANCAASAPLCNGTGNKLVNWTAGEHVLAWKHLSLAGLISGNFTGSGGVDLIIGTNVPGSAFSGGAWYIDADSAWASLVDSGIGVKNRLNIGAKEVGSLYQAPLFTPREASSIDIKTDDGVPYRGKAITTGGWVGGLNPNCTQGAGASSSYQLTTTTASCHMMFELLK